MKHTQNLILSLLLLSFAKISYAELIDNGDGTVSDTGTGLMWLQDVDSLGQMTQPAAKATVADLVFATYDDWRLPEIDELQDLYASLIATGQFNSAPFINLEIDGYSDWFWSNTASAPVCWWFCMDGAYYFEFDSGMQNSASVFYYFGTLAVRNP